MSRASISALDCQWDSYEVLNVERDRRCVGQAHSTGRKCRHIVNWADMDTFHNLLTELSLQTLNATALQHRLRQLASLGLCRQVHRRAQVNFMVDKWTMKIENAARLAELQPETRHGRTHIRITASPASTETLRGPGTHVSRSSTSTISTGSSRAIHATPRCLQGRILQVPNAPRLDPVRPITRVPTASVPSLHLSDPSSDASRTSRSHASPTPRHSASVPATSSASVPATSSASVPATSSASVPATSSASVPATSSASVPATSSASVPATSSRPTSSRSTSRAPSDSPPPNHRSLAPTPSTTPRPPIHIPSPPAPSALPATIPSATPASSPPRCTTTHVPRLPVSDDCPICCEAMQEHTALQWCRSGCGKSVHSVCMDGWRASCAANGREGGCTMCRARWEACGC